MDRTILNKWLPLGVPKLEYYKSFCKLFTAKHPSLIKTGTSGLSVIQAADNWNPTDAALIGGVYTVGYLDDIKVELDISLDNTVLVYHGDVPDKYEFIYEDIYKEAKE